MDQSYSAEKNRPVETSITDAMSAARSTDARIPDLTAIAAGERSKWNTAAILIMLTIHALFVAAMIFILIAVVPRFKKTFADFGMKMPIGTEVLIDISDWMVAFWYLVPLALAPLLVADGAALYLLRRHDRTRILARVWFILILLLLMASCGAMVGAIFQPHMELMEGLSK
jgi:type II secretory pathway component PulF